MRRSLVALVVVALALAAALAAPAARDTISVVTPAATCTAQQKQVRLAALRAFQRTLPARRRAFYRTHPSRAQRAAFERRQQQKLRALRAAAACTVTLPPQEGSPCAPELAPVTDEAFEAATGWAVLTEGTRDAKDFVDARGALRAVVVPVDFTDLPQKEDAAVAGRAATTDLRWFRDVSSGRFTVSATVLPRWYRMPRTLAAYLETPNETVYSLFADATRTADTEVDFSQYGFVYVVLPANQLFPNVAVVRIPGRGVLRDGTELRHGTVMTTTTPEVANHELLHTLGLPDLYLLDFERERLDTEPVGAWDPMSVPRNQELLGWHKWLLRWIDARQIACLERPGTLNAHLTPMAARGGVKLLVVPTSSSTAYVVEARAELGRDAPLFPQGVLVYTVDARLRSGRGPVRVLRAPGTPAASAVLARNSRFEDDVIAVEVLRPLRAGTWHVRITRKS